MRWCRARTLAALHNFTRAGRASLLRTTGVVCIALLLDECGLAVAMRVCLGLAQCQVHKALPLISLPQWWAALRPNVYRLYAVPPFARNTHVVVG